MSPEPPRLQPLTRARVASLGAAGEAWTRALPGVLAELSRAWSLDLGRALPGGSASYVVAARQADGTPCVVKVAVTADGLREQAATLVEADGRGYVSLLASDLDRHALLLERLGPSLLHDPGPPEVQLRLLADTLLRAWLPVPGPSHPERPAVDKAASLHRLVREEWVRLGEPCPARVVAQALAYAEQLQDDAAQELVVVHGDPHPGNLLAVPVARPGAETGSCFVDPDGFVTDRAYDLGVALRDWSSRLRGPDPVRVLRGYADVLASRTGADPERVWRWGFLERVSTGLHVLGFGAAAAARPLLESAARLLD